MDYTLPIPIFSAPSGAGKTTVARGIIELSLGKYELSISATNRSKRPNEVDGKDYHFLSTADFRTKIENNEFIECEEVYPGQFYGTLKSEIKRMNESGITPVFDVDVRGALNLKKLFGDSAMSIFIDPPSMKTLETRLRKRGTESEEQILRRLAKADRERLASYYFDHIVVNKEKKMANTIAQCHRILLSKVGYKE